MSDVKVWDAPRIGRYEGMQLEEAAYQRVVLASDYAALRAEVERLTQERNDAEGAAIIRTDDWRADDLEQFQQQRDAALAEVERLKSLVGGYQADNQRLFSEGFALTAEVERLRAALGKYAQRYVSVGWQYRFPSPYGDGRVVWRDSCVPVNGSQPSGSREIFARATGQQPEVPK